MESKSCKSPVSQDELSQAAKRLNAAKTTEKTNALDYDEAVAQSYAKMYDDFKGDVERIFEELGENPHKVRKYPPKDAEEFGIKYAKGFYTMVISSESK